MDRFIILGGNSRLAKAFIKIFPLTSRAFSKEVCDITDTNSIEKLLSKTNAKYVLNCAAITDIDWCETNLEKCIEINSTSTKILEKICKSKNKKLIQISSNYALFPINVYGISKLMMENILDKQNTLIIRTSFYYEKYKPLLDLYRGKKVEAYSNVYFNPISIYRLVNEIYKNRNHVGIKDIFSSKKISKYEFLLLFSKIFDFDAKLIAKTKYSNLNKKIDRPLDSYVTSDIKINITKDLEYFKEYSDFSKVS